METPYAMPPHMAGQPQYFYYSEPQHREHGQLPPQGHPMHPYNGQMSPYPPAMAPHMVYGPMPMHLPPNSYPHPMHAAVHMAASQMTPVASPQPQQRKPMIIIQSDPHALMPLDTRSMEMHHYLPSTPPLSAAGSSISSPLSSNDMLPTPIGEVFLAQGVEGVKEGCEGEVHSEILANIDWSRAGSPPMTPGKSIKS